MSQPQQTTYSKSLIWIGRFISALPVLMLLMSGVMKFNLPADAAENMEKVMGWKTQMALGLGIVEIVSTLLYVIPQTAVLGAILLTGYLGGAVATHVRVADWLHMPIPLVAGILVWVGLYLRDARLRDLLPLRKI
jgi:uncharacterized membrane protein YphA (DoxX/SURF4 family)